MIIIVFIMQVIVGILVFHYRNKVSIVWLIVEILVFVYRNKVSIMWIIVWIVVSVCRNGVRYNILWVFYSYKANI